MNCTKRMNLGECQAKYNGSYHPYAERASCCICPQTFSEKNKIPVYGDCVFLPEIKPSMQSMADELGVSFTAMLIQLRKYGLLEERDMAEYFDKIKVGDRNG